MERPPGLSRPAAPSKPPLGPPARGSTSRVRPAHAHRHRTARQSLAGGGYRPRSDRTPTHRASSTMTELTGVFSAERVSPSDLTGHPQLEDRLLRDAGPASPSDSRGAWQPWPTNSAREGRARMHRRPRPAVPHTRSGDLAFPLVNGHEESFQHGLPPSGSYGPVCSPSQR